MSTRSSGWGFTLIELLISIVIIGLLAGIVVISLGAARKSARDTRRKADINLLATALEQYRATSKVYPPVNGSYTSQDNDRGWYNDASTFITALVTSALTSRVPNDPRFEDYKNTCESTGQDCWVRYHHSYSYRVISPPDLCWGSNKNGNGGGYLLFGWLENTSDPDAPKRLTTTQGCDANSHPGVVWTETEGAQGYDTSGAFLFYGLAK